MLPSEPERIDQTMWWPLELVVGERYLPDFMFMGKKQISERWVFLYKHIVTRCYLNLDENGGAYRYEGATYVAMDLEQALARVFGSDAILLGKDRFREAIDVVELSRIFKYADKIHLYFVVLDPEIALSSLASACASGSEAQLKEWINRGQVTILEHPEQIPGHSVTSAEVLLSKEAYFVKPALKSVSSNHRKSANGVLIQRVSRESLPAFLKQGIEAIFISDGVDLDDTVQTLLKGDPLPVGWLSKDNEVLACLKDTTDDNNGDSDFDLAMISTYVVCKNSCLLNANNG